MEAPLTADGCSLAQGSCRTPMKGVLRIGNLQRRKVLTLEGLIAVISLCLTCFSIGYTLGHDKSNKK